MRIAQNKRNTRCEIRNMSNSRSKKPTQRRPGPPGRKGKKPPLPSYKRGPLGWLILAVVVFTAMMMMQQWRSTDKINWNDFKNYLQNNQIESIEIGETEITGKFNQRGIAERSSTTSSGF